jgi:hypothetical protein
MNPIETNKSITFEHISKKYKQEALEPSISEKQTDKIERMWELITTQDECHVYKIKDRFNEVKNPSVTDLVNNQLKKLFPAVEPLPKHFFNTTYAFLLEKNLHLGEKEWVKQKILNLDTPKNSLEERKACIEELRKTFKRFSFLQQLGFKLETNELNDYFIFLPSKERLMRYWNPKLPKLEIILNDGLFTDEAFIKAYIKKQIPISSSEEEVHDYLFHLLSFILQVVFQGASVTEKERERIRLIILKAYERYTFVKNLYSQGLLKEHPLVETDFSQNLNYTLSAIGAFTDFLSNELSVKIENKIDEVFFEEIWSKEDDPFFSYMKKRFENENPGPDFKKLKTFWNLLKKIESEFKKETESIKIPDPNDSFKVDKRFKEPLNLRKNKALEKQLENFFLEKEKMEQRKDP